MGFALRRFRQSVQALANQPKSNSYSIGGWLVMGRPSPSGNTKLPTQQKQNELTYSYKGIVAHLVILSWSTRAISVFAISLCYSPWQSEMPRD
jgi:hypothetical protein